MRPTRLFWLLLAFLLILDQGSKEWVQRCLPRYGSVEVLGHYFQLTYVRNTGVAFGMMAGRNYWLAGFTIVLLGAGWWWARQLDWRQREINILGAALLAGALGNWADRLRHGYVVDFFDFSHVGYPWVFNVADSCITLSLLWIIFRQMLPEKSSTEPASR